MFSNYLATQKDLKTVEDGLRFVMHPKMRFVFKDKSKIVNTAVISYDSKFIYIWKINPVKSAFKIPHSLNILDEWQSGWRVGIISEKILKYLPVKNKKMISGGLLTPFVSLQKAKTVVKNPYITKESYLATIVHEFGHIYFGGVGKKGELSAFCTEYYASQLFWPKHLDKLDKFIEKIASTTKSKAEKNNQHIFAFLNAKKLINRYPKTWPQKLLSTTYLGIKP
jgi:hypothetical protein